MARLTRQEPQQAASDEKPSWQSVRVELNQIASEWLAMADRTELPPPMPGNLGNGIGWFLQNIIEPEKPYEGPRQVSGPLGVRWEYPFSRRAIHAFRTFLGMSEQSRRDLTEIIQNTGLHWRGDELPLFYRMAAEYEEMQADKPKYIRQAFANMKAMASKQDARNSKLRGE